ncbi:MAG: type II restriction endonuclease [Chloroflexi bacterium]|nr:type II restriction endonuclease [Chloroflexota bacterium]
MARLSGRYLVALKRLSEVEVDPESSNQHELNGVSAIKQLLGTPTDVMTIPEVEWVLLRDDGRHLRERHTLSWYDSRRGNPHRSAEWRLYYRGGTTAAEAGDLFALIRREQDGALAAFIAPKGSTWNQQVIAILGNPLDPGGKFVPVEFGEIPDFFTAVASELFELLNWGEDPEPVDSSPFSGEIAAKFGFTFPSTYEFSKFIQDRVPVDPNEPDDALLAWWRAEEAHFREQERRIVEMRLAEGFEDVDEFLTFSKSVHNRRRARAGLAFENHLRALFESNGLRHSFKKRTEGKSEPDILFPGIEQYRDPEFDDARLTMLAAKTTCKDRWRQVLQEAARIKRKHLCTLEPAISTDQLKEMELAFLVLVAPAAIVSSYRTPAGYQVLSIAEFIELVRERDSVN